MKKSALLFIISIIFLTSCSRQMIQWTELEGDFDKWKKFALIELIVCPPHVSATPIVDRIIYMGNMEDIILGIQKFNSSKSLDVYNHLGQIISKYSNNKIIYGNELFTDSAYIKLKNEIPIYDHTLDNEEFNNFEITDGQYNFFNLRHVHTPDDYFNSQTLGLYNGVFKRICERLNVDGIIFGTLAVNTESIGLFGQSGSREMDLKLYFVDRKGKFVLMGRARSKSTSSSGNDFIVYKYKFEEYFYYADALIRKLYGLPQIEMHEMIKVDEIEGNIFK